MIIRALSLILLVFHVLAPHAAFGLSGQDCACVKDGVRCGQHGFVCHCCRGENPGFSGGQTIKKCRAFGIEYSVSNPPALPQTSFMGLLEANLSGSFFTAGSLIYRSIETSPLLRPPR